MPGTSVDIIDDLRLADAIKQGSQQSLAVLYDKYAPALSGIISRITNNEKQVEDILTSTFLQIWNQIATFNPSNSSLFSWLIKIARQTALEAVKTEKEKNPQNNNFVDKTPQQRLNQKSAFELVYYKGLTYSQAATQLAITVPELLKTIRTNIEDMKEKAVTE
jgi:DNA-directed RNA polymerase specialized sigma24 family protein